jgi:hypothetical protein
MKISGKARRLCIYIGERDTWQGQPLYHAIVKKVRQLDMAGATVLRGLEGFGANSRIHTARVLALSTDLPVVIEIVDSVEYIEKLLPFLDEVVREGLVTLEDVEVVKYTENEEGETGDRSHVDPQG